MFHLPKSKTVAIYLLVIFFACFLFPNRASLAAPGPIPRKSLFYLLLGPRELPVPVVLQTFQVQSAENPYSYDVRYAGEKEKGYFVTIRVNLHPDQAGAVRTLEREAKSYAVIPIEVSGKDPYVDFSDKAYVYPANDGRISGTIRYARANTTVEIHVRCKKRSDYKDMLRIAKSVTRRIDRAAAGKPYAIPIMPIARGYQDFTERAWGKRGSEIALADQYGISWLFPAKRISDSDYVIPLNSVSQFLKIYQAPRHYESKGRAAAKLNGRLLFFEDGSKCVSINGKPYSCSVPIRIYEGRALAPLSLIEYVMHKRFIWTKREGVAIGRLSK